MGYEVTRFTNVENIEDFLCPICHDVFKEPLLIRYCEHMFCSLCISSWTDQNSSCPVDRLQIRKSDLRTPSRFFRNQFNRLKMKCRFYENGCEDIVQMDKISNHEKSCSFNPDDLQLCKLIDQMTLNISVEQKTLVDSLKASGRIKSINVEDVMLAVDRNLFGIANPYRDRAQRIAYGSSISAPHMHAKILELLSMNLQSHAKVLDIGSGSGYLTICMALTLKGTGKVFGIDHVSQLVDRSSNIVREHFRNLSQSEIEFIWADGRSGYLSEGPYDAINVGGGLDEVPKIIIDQLKPNGRIVVPLNFPNGQVLYTIDKSHDGTIIRQRHGGVRFQQITDLEEQIFL